MDAEHARSRAASVCALLAIGAFSGAIILGWGVIGLLIVVGVFALVAAVRLARPRRSRG